MRNFVLLIFLVGSLFDLSGQQDKILFYIDDEPVYVSEFKYIYEKNNRDQADYSKESIEEYLDLYINFKLKVKKAKALGYHESKAYQEELAGYRTQLADSYVINREVISKMVDEIFERQQYDVELRHLLISCPRKASQQKLEEAKSKIEVVQKEIEKGMTFERAIVQFSQDRNSARVGGDIGFIHAPLPDGYVNLEDAAYTLEEGEISEPIRTDLGFHLIQVVSKRKARGIMEAQHILIRKEKNGILLADALPRINRIYNDIVSGNTSFENAASIYSEDRQSKGNGGNLGFFGIGQFERSFEDAAFALQEDGAVSEPVETSVGWHIIRRVSKRNADTKAVIEERIKSQPRQGDRFERKRDEVVMEIQKEAGYSENIDLLTSYSNELSEDFFGYNWQIPDYDKTSLCSYGEDEYDLNDFSAFAKENSKIRMRAKGQQSIQATVEELYQSFVIAKAIAFAEDRLEERYPEFKNLMREYREGILLFDITKDFVWDKASSDTTEVRKYFNRHQDDYQWKKRVEVTRYSVRSIDPSVVTPILNTAATADPMTMIERFNQDKELVLYREEVLEEGHKTIEHLTHQEGFVSKPNFNRQLEVTTFDKVEEVIPARAKTLQEAKGYVISDYQDELDQNWIKELKSEFDIKLQKKTLKGLIQSD